MLARLVKIHFLEDPELEMGLRWWVGQQGCFRVSISLVGIDMEGWNCISDSVNSWNQTTKMILEA